MPPKNPNFSEAYNTFIKSMNITAAAILIFAIVMAVTVPLVSAATAAGAVVIPLIPTVSADFASIARAL